MDRLKLKEEKRKHGESSPWSEPPKTPPSKLREVDKRFTPNGAMVPPDPEVQVDEKPPLPPMVRWRIWDLQDYEADEVRHKAGNNGEWDWVPSRCTFQQQCILEVVNNMIAKRKPRKSWRR